jgi:hypothetical protein
LSSIALLGSPFDVNQYQVVPFAQRNLTSYIPVLTIFSSHVFYCALSSDLCNQDAYVGIRVPLEAVVEASFINLVHGNVAMTFTRNFHMNYLTSHPFEVYLETIVKVQRVHLAYTYAFVVLPKIFDSYPKNAIILILYI